MPDVSKIVATPVSVPKRCVSCKQKVGGKHVIVLCICADCANKPNSMLAYLLLQEWRGIK